MDKPSPATTCRYPPRTNSSQTSPSSPPRPAALPRGGALLRPQPSQHRHLLRRGTGRQRPPGRHSHACPEGSPHAVVARAGAPLPGSSHRRTPRLEPPKGLSFVRRSERIQERRTPWEALRPPRECVSFTRCCYCARFPYSIFQPESLHRLSTG